MTDQPRRIANLLSAADKSAKAMERSLLALEALVGQHKGILAELRKALADPAAAEPGRSRRKRKPVAR